LSWFVQNNNAQTTPSPSGTDLKVKPMLDGRLRRKKIHSKPLSVNVRWTPLSRRNTLDEIVNLITCIKIMIII